MKLKLNDEGLAFVKDGMPVYVSDDGKEITHDPIGMRSTITRLGDESKTFRERAESAEKKLKTFADITDPAAAIDALQTVSDIDNKKLIDAGDAEKVRTEITKSFEVKIAERDETINGLKSDLHIEKIGGKFSRSTYISEKLIIPSDVVEAVFGKNFKLEEGKIVAYDNNGNSIFSPDRPGEPATFDEALSVLVEGYANKNSLLKGAGQSGSGADGGKGGEDVAKNPWKTDTRNLTEQGRITRDDPELAARLKKAAGK